MADVRRAAIYSGDLVHLEITCDDGSNWHYICRVSWIADTQVGLIVPPLAQLPDVLAGRFRIWSQHGDDGTGISRRAMTIQLTAAPTRVLIVGFAADPAPGDSPADTRPAAGREGDGPDRPAVAHRGRCSAWRDHVLLTRTAAGRDACRHPETPSEAYPLLRRLEQRLTWRQLATALVGPDFRGDGDLWRWVLHAESLGWLRLQMTQERAPYDLMDFLMAVDLVADEAAAPLQAFFDRYPGASLADMSAHLLQIGWLTPDAVSLVARLSRLAWWSPTPWLHPAPSVH